MTTLRLSHRLAVAALLTLATASAWAQAWPSKPVRIVVGFSAGGPTDVVARAFAEHAARALGQPVIVDNKPGANTILAAEAVAAAPADGYTLLMAATNHTMIPALYSARVKFDAVRSFAPICTLAVSPTVLVTGPAMTAKTLGAFMQQVREAPGKRSYGTPGTGSSGHFASEQFLRMTGLSMNHIPYKGAAQVVTDVMGGQLDSSFATLGSVLPQVQGGKLTALAVASPRRSSLLPNVPTFAEAGVKGYTADAWYGLLAPAGTPAAVLQTLEKVAAQFTEQAGTVAKLQSLGMEPQHSCGSTFGADMDRDAKAYAQLARALDLKAE
ncbi:Bug family tripartite tricarboxylate transporter substrate binding protein [Limnohabitans radicicola]|uniref:Tripartite tricarboxylate transporter substrate binding protein n=1 Tax=Limnohabitans radicicola TaxID=2771427 RepID=A0A927FIN4_9BURK|nr:tripartite tricarboxylate transporter substrate-binding protein [Limnohabitans radicicola]MBD8050743.1 tripartite tricarboxylate transporter substrate binding protein [Limnohabitans radicicola]